MFRALQFALTVECTMQDLTPMAPFDFGKDIANATVYTYPNVGHLPMEEVPEKSINDFTMFLNTIKNDNLD